MYYYLLTLRILHIACGVMWAGTAFLLALYIFPAIIRSGPDGGKMMQAITSTNKFPVVLTLASLITVLSGLLLMWQLSAGFNGAWFGTKYGMALSTGGLTALIAFLQAFFINRPGVLRMQAIAGAAAAKGGPPSEADRSELQRIRDRVYLSTKWIGVWLLIAVVMMAGARYF
jgi:uncharacterized membrane protein